MFILYSKVYFAVQQCDWQKKHLTNKSVYYLNIPAFPKLDKSIVYFEQKFRSRPFKQFLKYWQFISIFIYIEIFDIQIRFVYF